MKYECNGCLSTGCKVELPDVVGIPTHCVLVAGAAHWHPIPAPAPKHLSSAILPKLSVEVFDREDCPEWAQWAGVNQDGTASFFGNVPNRGCSNPRKNYWSYHHSEMMQIPGQFDASVWQNSLIKRPEKKKLPDWVKVGAWVWNESQGRFAQVTAIAQRIQLLDITEQKGYMDDVDCLKPARLRPWTFEEAPLAFKTKDDVFRLFYSTAEVWKYHATKRNVFYTLAEVAELTQLSGEPCGVLEVAEVGK